MLDIETKRRIDTARDILVGKVPDPKSQVEQITIALVYKFMDDMDKESLEMGGKAAFFSGEFEKYGWSKIFDPHMGGFEMLALYADAITRMSQNPNLPQLFRDIFKNAYLPYRDPETLKLFLKTINEFTYDQSERLGDAFEYLLSVMSSQGDAGQFRTPRHIIDFMVQVVKPQKNETILDPACGTAGFLISAYKYILNDPANKKSYPGDLLSPEDKKKLLTNFKGYDISPDMVRLSLVNLYLHGFVQPQIYEYDTLTSEERWNDYADVILANPPFMSPKGGIKPHKRFSVQSNRSEVLFVDYMAEHLTPTGRAAIIVPEGIIFQSAGAYKQLRKYLVEQNYLWAVVSLPSGVFNPYAGVKTSVLFLDRVLAKRSDRILFVKVEADGYDLGAQRRPVEVNDLPDAVNVLTDWQFTLHDAAAVGFDPLTKPCSALLVAKKRLAEGDEYNLSSDRYRKSLIVKNKKYKVVSLGDVCQINPRKSEISENRENTLVSFVPMEDLEEHRMFFTPKKERTLGDVYKGYTYFKNDDVLLAKVTPCFENGKSGIARNLNNGIGFGSSEYFVLRASAEILPEYIYWMITRQSFIDGGKRRMTGTGGLQRVPIDYVANYLIPLPPLEVQRQIMEEIEACQRVIDGARQVVEAWKPNLELELEEERKSTGVDAWDIFKLGDVCQIKGGKRLPKGESFAGEKNNHPYIRVIDMQNGSIDQSNLKFITTEVFSEIKNYTISKDNVYISIAGTIGLFGTIPSELDGANLTENAAKLVFDQKKISKFFLKYLGNSRIVQEQVERLTHAVGVPKLALERIRTIEIPLPPLPAQCAIVERIESERRAVEGNRTLIATYETKIQKIIAQVWEG